ncbi:hypothetical protein L227DRAFT_612012 [Lentinus tigrinus ALCF2SS1-6]|uniref:Uncharacterized protein n=1 Tax=Lentinus tigrinus ALCF2SS1-6 TaxID=1328759 RepID=A0A5C2S6G0_9APHY|nr:hypothetical protein L227DRAFT_612012 [Lentinus tigrinus ALCF2SS1-6]
MSDFRRTPSPQSSLPLDLYNRYHELTMDQLRELQRRIQHAREIRTAGAEDVEPSELNEVTNELPYPLTPEQREQFGFGPTGDRYWAGPVPFPDWGALTGGGWGKPDPVQEPTDPNIGGVLSVVRTDATRGSGDRHPIEDVAIHLSGSNIAAIDWQQHSEIMLPFPTSVADASTWPDMPNLYISLWSLSATASAHLRVLQQIFAWFSRPHTAEQSDALEGLWAMLLDRLLAETSPLSFDPVDALRRFIEYVHTILPADVWEIEVTAPGHMSSTSY